MFNVRLVLTLLNINGLGRKTINKILKYELPTNLEATTILHFLNKCKFNIKKNVSTIKGITGIIYLNSWKDVILTAIK